MCAYPQFEHISIINQSTKWSSNSTHSWSSSRSLNWSSKTSHHWSCNRMRTSFGHRIHDAYREIKQGKRAITRRMIKKIILSKLRCRKSWVKMLLLEIKLKGLKKTLEYQLLLRQSSKLNLISLELKLLIITRNQKPLNIRFKNLWAKTISLEMKSETLKRTCDSLPLKSLNSPINSKLFAMKIKN